MTQKNLKNLLIRKIKLNFKGYIKNGAFDIQDPENWLYPLTTLLGDSELSLNIDITEVSEQNDYYWQTSYYSRTIGKTIILNYDSPQSDTVEELADYILGCNQEAIELETKLLNLNN